MSYNCVPGHDATSKAMVVDISKNCLGFDCLGLTAERIDCLGLTCYELTRGPYMHTHCKAANTAQFSRAMPSRHRE